MDRVATPRSVIYSLGASERAYCERLTGLPFENYERAYLRAAGENVMLDDLPPARARRVLQLAAEVLRRGFNPRSDPQDLSHPIFVAEVTGTVSSSLDEPASWPADCEHHAIILELRARESRA